MNKPSSCSSTSSSESFGAADLRAMGEQCLTLAEHWELLTTADMLKLMNYAAGVKRKHDEMEVRVVTEGDSKRRRTDDICAFDAIPFEVLQHILHNLSYAEVVACSAVCHQFRAVAIRLILPRPIVIRNLPELLELVGIPKCAGLASRFSYDYVQFLSLTKRIVANKELSTILSRFKRVVHLEMRVMSSESKQIVFDRLYRRCVEHDVQLITRAHITPPHLDLPDDIRVPETIFYWTIVRGCSMRVDFRDAMERTPFPASSRIFIHELYLDLNLSRVDWNDYDTTPTYISAICADVVQECLEIVHMLAHLASNVHVRNLYVLVDKRVRTVATPTVALQQVTRNLFKTLSTLDLWGRNVDYNRYIDTPLVSDYFAEIPKVELVISSTPYGFIPECFNSRENNWDQLWPTNTIYPHFTEDGRLSLEAAERTASASQE